MTSSGPADRFGHLFDLIGDPVVEIELVDRTPVVRAVNPAFEDLFGYDREEVLGESLNEFIVPDDQASEADRFDRRTSQGKPNTGLITRQTAGGPREFVYRGIPYERDGSQYGFAIYTDVTEQRRYERHFKVIHRLLRHDLSNNLQVVAGAAEQVTDEAASPRVADLGERIIDHAERLLSAGEEARIIERVLLEDLDPVPVDVAAVCRAVADEYDGAHPSATVVAETPDSRTVVGSRWLRDAVEAVVENAVDHGGDDPTVSVVTRSAEERVVVEVVDDGPGIPQKFRAPVFEDSDITQFQHNRGIGLWLVRWVTESCGGDVAYERVDDRTIVRLELQPAPSEETATGAGSVSSGVDD